MRDAFFEALADLARDDERVWALTGDLGIGLFDDFERVAPGRYLNVGIAEQNLVGVAAGLAYAGRVPFAYSIAPFITSRPHDQIRVDVLEAVADEIRHMLEEGVVGAAADIDACLILGAGYPWSGGESTNSFYPTGSILRVQAFRPR